MFENLTKSRRKKKNQNITKKKNKDFRNSLWITQAALKEQTRVNLSFN